MTSPSPPAARRSGGLDRRRILVAGFLATCAALALAAVVHVVAYDVAFPPQALAQRAVGATSGRFDSFFIQTLGHWAERLFVIGISIGYAASGAVVARLLPRSVLARAVGWLLVPLPAWALGVGLYSAPQPFLGRWGFALATLPVFALGGLAGWRSFARMSALPEARRSARGAASPLGPEVTRRSLLAALGLGGLGVAIGSSGLATLLSGGSDTGSVRLRTGRVVRAALPTPAPADAAFGRVAGLTPEITPIGRFYVVDKDILRPVIDASTWRLRVHGLVDRPLSLTYADLRSVTAYERYQTLECISNRVGGHYMSNALWTGVRLRDVLARAGVRSNATTVVFRSAEGYSESHDLGKAMDPTTLLAIGMNRHELPRIHGYPARLLTVGTYGMKNPKWLTDVELIDGPYRGYWEARGWAPDVDPKITTRIDVPSNGAGVSGRTTIGGVAFAGDRGISRVEVSTDGGRSWNEATLKTALSPYTWRLWMYEWEPKAASTFHVLARAYDDRGTPQQTGVAPPFPSGASGLEGIIVRSP